MTVARSAEPPVDAVPGDEIAGAGPTGDETAGAGPTGAAAMVDSAGATRVRTTGEAIVDGLIAHGVDMVFGIPGVQTYGIYDALAQVSDRITTFTTRHEQGAAWMAFGYGQSTGRPGVFSVVPGPGVLNAGAALLSGFGASTPMVCLTSEIPTAFMGRGLGHLHEMPDQLATLRTVTKWAANVLHPSDAAAATTEAFLQATGGRPRPVALATPWDTLTQRAETAPCLPARPSAVKPDPEAVERAAGALKHARQPIVLVGSGAQHASPEVTRLAEQLQAPVVPFRGGRGVVDSDHPLGFSCADGFDYWQDVDVVVGIGSRMELAWFRWGPRPAGQTTILIDIDPQQHVRLTPEIGLVTDAGVGAAAISAALGEHRAADRTSEFRALRAAKQDDIDGYLQPHMAYLHAMRRVMPRDAFLVEEVSQMGFAATFGFPFHEPRTFVTCGHQGTLGFGYPTSLGVKAAHPDRVVVSLNGDGGFLFGSNEIATAVQYGLGVVAVVFDNQSYGNVLNDQRRLFNRPIGSELRNPDWVAMARSFGAAGARADSPDELQTELARAIAADEPAVISVSMPLDGTRTPWKFLMPTRKKP